MITTIIKIRDCFGDDTKIIARRTPRIDRFSVYDCDGFPLYEIIRYRCSANYYIKTLSGNLTPLLMRDLFPGWKITGVFNNG